MDAENTTLQHAGIIKRFAAMFYDAFLVMAICMTYGAIILWVNVQFLDLSLAEGEKAKMAPLPFIGMLLLIASFFCVFWHKQGQTLGMQAWKLKLVDENGNNPSLKQCLLRLAYASVSFATLGLGYWWFWIDKEQLTWHDRWSRTRVLQLNKN